MSTESSNDPSTPPERTLTQEDRGRLVAAMHRRATRMAATRPDAALAGVLAGDLARIAFQVMDDLAAELREPGPSAEKGQKAELALRYSRELTRTLELERKLAEGAEPPPSRQLRFGR